MEASQQNRRTQKWPPDGNIKKYYLQMGIKKNIVTKWEYLKIPPPNGKILKYRLEMEKFKIIASGFDLKKISLQYGNI